MPKTEKQIIGALGEALAEKHLKKLGFSILVKNYLKPWGEIDIVAKKGKEVHFVEVKTVTRTGDYVTRGTDDYEPEDNIHPWKLKRLYRAINSYLMEQNLDEDEVDWQLDVMAVYLEKGSNKLLKVEYLPDIL